MSCLRPRRRGSPSLSVLSLLGKLNEREGERDRASWTGRGREKAENEEAKTEGKGRMEGRSSRRWRGTGGDGVHCQAWKLTDVIIDYQDEGHEHEKLKDVIIDF